ncbi:MAG: dihydroxyacetone kinase subunit DhaK [Candidatus Izemoplasmataceae bacterium]
MTKKLINSKEAIVQDMISGFEAANSQRLYKLENADVLVSRHIVDDTVGVLIGNGSGHEPACIGFVGYNMLDANAYGGMFAAPGPKAILEGIKAVDRGKGTCLLISNHEGDVINSKLAIRMARKEGYKVEPLLLHDDIASAPKDAPLSERRGAAGTLFAYKMVGTYANKGHALESVVAFGKRVRDHTRTLSLSIESGTSPVTGAPFFELDEDVYEIGMGVHGETQNNQIRKASSDELAKTMTDMLLEESVFDDAEEVAVLVNGMGRTTMMELHIFYNDVLKALTTRDIRSFRPLVGNFITSQDTSGVMLSFIKLDDTMKAMLTEPCHAANFPNLDKGNQK